MHSELKKVSRGVNPTSLNLPMFTAVEIQPLLPAEDWPSRYLAFQGTCLSPGHFLLSMSLQITWIV